MKAMRIKSNNYLVFPRVFPCNKDCQITITPLGELAKFDDHKTYTVKIISKEIYSSSRLENTFPFEVFNVTPKNGKLSFNYCFETEQEWALVLLSPDGEEQRLCWALYSLEKDLYTRTPYKGDFHVHSCCSDGADTPGMVAANYRKAGFDFLALTDHYQWKPSDDLINLYRNLPIDLKLFHGEEVHPYDIIHIVNFGGNRGVTDLYRSEEEKNRAMLEKEAENIKDRLPEGINAMDYVYRKWVTDQIRACGGMPILAHPCWILPSHEYNMNLKMVDFDFYNHLCDAYEILGGQTVLENNLQVAIYHEQRAMGRKIPIVGSSDSHGTDPALWFNQAKTVVFSNDCELQSICDSIRELYSVAVETMPGEDFRVHGTLRLVRYGSFLINNYFPHHDALCFEEGCLMREWLSGNLNAETSLAHLQGRTTAYARQFFGRDLRVPIIGA